MASLEEKYNSVKAVLGSYRNELQRVDARREKERQTYENEIQEAEERLSNSRQELKQRITRTKAMLDIAKTHTSKHIPAMAPISYDHGVLSRLAVQISSGNPNDSFAEKLYTEASGQLMMLENEHDHLEEKFAEERTCAEKGYENKDCDLKREKERLVREVNHFLRSQDVDEFVTNIKSRESVFRFNKIDNWTDYDGSISVGIRKEQLPVCNGCEETYQSVFGCYIDIPTETITLPADIDLSDVSSILVKYENENEQSILGGINNLIINFGRVYRDSSPHVFFFDPIRYNASALGKIAALCGHDESLIENVPTSPDEIKKTIKSIVDELNQNELLGKESDKKLLIVVHNFPQGYDGNVISQIQQLCVNSKHFNINVLLTTNISGNAVASSDVIKYIESFSYVLSHNKCHSVDGKTDVPFR